MPASFSPEAKDLIHRMIQPDPLKRIKFSEIRLHPFVRENIPFYLEIFNMSTRIESNKKINEEVF